MLNNSNKDKMYMKFLICKIIESKLNKIENKINKTQKLLNFNYSNIKKEFKKEIKKYHEGGYYVDDYSIILPYNSLYSREILIPDNYVFTNNNITTNNQEKNNILHSLNKLNNLSRIVSTIIKKDSLNNAVEEINKINKLLIEDQNIKTINDYLSCLKEINTEIYNIIIQYGDKDLNKKLNEIIKN
jgi:hypothetical protein